MIDIVERLRAHNINTITQSEINAAAAEIETLRGWVKGLLTVIDMQEPYVTTHLFRTGERLDESEVLPLHAIVAEARNRCD